MASLPLRALPSIINSSLTPLTTRTAARSRCLVDACIRSSEKKSSVSAMFFPQCHLGEEPCVDTDPPALTGPCLSADHSAR